MPKQLNVDLRFNADTSQAKKQIQDLQQTLSKLGTDSIKSLNFDKMNSELLEANQNVNKLKAQLTSAFNTNTGKLDLTKFTQEMERSGMSLEKYQKSLMALGPEGSKAFAELANSIAAADIPLMRTNRLLTEMGTVLKNTIKWQISSSAIHGFMGAIQQAYGYAQDLNESLTNIRIVTGQSTEQMAAFADRANKAAQALSTTTTAYTDAALIFYQQGLSDSEVEERTNAVIKMSQATGDAATEVSSYMTAVWNNFDNGAESLEHYSDVITALGAATASSSSEIAQGLEKFASIADTVGLSYEYATTALATVVAQTRQSADVVGTAFKTMFARFQDLELGKTLEDGTELGQYSKALEKVGIDIKDANGNLRDMNDILDDMGERWATLADDEKVALAQNVAGQRQYAQLVALMDNWGEFQKNLKTATTADGTLQEQADTYAESWEAAQKRVKASMESIYQSIIDDKFFIEANNFLADNLNGINNLIKTLGGLPGLLSVIGTLVTRFFGPQMANGLRDMATNVMMLTSAGREKVKGQQLEALTRAQSGFADDSIESQIYKEKLKYQQTYLENAEKISEIDNLSLKYQQEQLETLSKETIELAKQREELEQQLSQKQSTMSELARKGNVSQADYAKSRREYSEQSGYLMSSGVKSVGHGYQLNELVTELQNAKSGSGDIKAIKSELKDLALQYNMTAEQKERFDKIINTPTSGAQAYEQIKEMFAELGVDINTVELYANSTETAYNNLIKTLTSGNVTTEEAREAVQGYVQTLDQLHETDQKIEQDMEQISEGYSEMGERAKISAAGIQDWAQKVVTGAQAISTLAMAINSLKGMFQTLTDENMSFGDKLLSVMTTLGMVIPMIASLAKTIDVQTAAQVLNLSVTKEATLADLAAAFAEEVRTKGLWQVVKALLAKAAAEMAAYWPLLLIAAAIGVVVAGYYAYSKALDRSTTSSEDAAKSASDLKKSVEEAQSAYDSLKQSIEDYSGAKNGLEQLTVGTLEWKEALLEVNQQAFDLIQKYNLIQGQDWNFGQNGEIDISDNTINGMLEQENNALIANTIASMTANANVNQVEADEERQRLINQEFTRNGGAMSEDAGERTRLLNQATIKIDEALEAYRNGTLAGLSDTTEEFRDDINNLGNMYGQAAESMQAAADSSARLLLAQNDVYNNLEDENLRELITGRYENYFNSGNQEAYQQAYSDIVDRWDLFGEAGTERAETAARNYARAMGWTNFDVTDFQGDGTLVASYTNQNGEYVEDQTIRPETIASVLAAAEAQGNLESVTEQLISTFEQLNSESSTLADNAFSHFLTDQNFDNATYGEFSDIYSDYYDNYYDENVSNYDTLTQYLTDQATALNMSLKEMATLAGYDSVDSYLVAFATGLNNSTQGWESLDTSQFTDNITNAVTLSTGNQINQILHDLDIGPLGEAAGNNFISALDSVLEDVDEDQRTEALNRFLNIDWEADDAIEQAAEAMEQYGVEIDTSSQYWQNFVDGMRSVSGYVPEFEELQTTLQNVSSILGKLDFGSTISQEDYEILVAYNDEWERFFILQADGTRKFIGDSQQMLNAARSQIRSQQLDLDSQRDLANNFNSSNNVNWSSIASGEMSKGQSNIISGLLNGSDTTQQVLEQLGYDSDRLNQILEDLGSSDEEVVATAREAVQRLASDIDGFVNYDFAEEAAELREMYASTATDFNELHAMFSQGLIDDDAYQKQSEYLLNTITSVEQLQDAYEVGYIALEQYQNALDGVVERQAEQLGLEGDSVLVQAQEMAEAYELEAGAAARLALQNQLMNRGVSTLSQNWEDWREELEKTDKTTQDYSDTVVDVTAAIRDLVGITDENFRLSSEFLKAEENLELLEEAAQGSEEAIDRLGVAVAQDLVGNLQSIEDSFDFSGLGISDSGFMHNIFDNFESDKNIVLSGLEELQDQINNLAIGDDVTQILGDDWINALNRMAVATSMSVDQMNDLLNSMGVEANVTTRTVKTHVSVPWYRTEETVSGGEVGKDGSVSPTIRETHTVATGFDTVPGEIEVAQLNTGKNAGKGPSITRIGNGGVGASSISSRSGSGGGGGKSGSEKKPKDPTGEIERYHVINNQIEDNEKALTRLSKAKDRAYGRARLNAMDAEIAKQRESVELAERKFQEVEKYLELDSGAIAAFGAEFDANGTIVNYDQLMQQQIDKYNAAVEAYNNSAMDENAEAVFQQAEDDYNAFTEALKQYEETQDLWYEQAQAVADAKAEVLQLELEKTNYKVEIGIEWEEEDIARLDFMLKRIEDDAHKAAEAIGLLGEKTVDAMDKYNVYQQGFADTLRNLGVSNAEDVIARASAGEDLYGMIGNIVDPNQMAQAVDQMDDYISNMMSSLEQAQEAVDQAFEKVKNVFSDNVKKMDEYIDKIEFCQKITKSYMNIVDIVGKKSLGITNEMLRTFNAESVTQAINNEAAAKAKMDTIQAQLMESQARLAQASGEAEQKYWNEIIEEQEKELISATENFHQAWEDALQANLEAFENNIELVIEDFSNAVGDLNAMKAEWDLQKSLTDMWEPEYERWHQLSDLINDINKSVDENENLKYKQDLLGLEQEIAALQEEEAQLSEYDLNYLRLRYEAKLAEIALEEAQNAKSQVRMSRDNEGNYSYVYTADEDAVNNAADDYRNKIYEMEKANEEYIDTLQEQLLDMHDKMLEDIKEAGDLYGIGTEAYFEAVDRIEQTYLGQSQFIQAQMQNVFDNNQRLRDEDIIQYVAYTSDIAAQNVDLQLSFADTYMGIQTQSDDLNTYFNDTWIPALETTFDNAREVTDHYVETNEAAMETAGTTMDEFSARATQDMAMATAQTEELARQTKNYGDTAVRAFAQAAQAWQTGPGSMLNAIESQAAAIANLAQQYTSLKSQLDAATASAIALAQAMNQPVSSSPSSVGGAAANGGSGSPGGNNPSSSPNNGLGTKDTLTNNNTKDTMTKDTFTKDTYGKGALVQSGKSATSSNSGNGNLLKKILQFASGGYTGEWSDEPRWALLDQKELVLNTKDTMNILSAVDVVRQLANSIDLNTMSANIAGASIKSASGTPGTIEQRVEITASFPNATDRNEIEQAFQNLVNHASQYANRKD